MSQVLIICKCTLLYNRLASLILILVTISVQNQQSHSVDMEDNQPPPSWNIYWEGLRNKKLKSELLLPNPSWSTMTPTTFLCSSRTHNAVLQALIPYQKGNAGYQLFGKKKAIPCWIKHLASLQMLTLKQTAIRNQHIHTITNHWGTKHAVCSSHNHSAITSNLVIRPPWCNEC